MNFESSIIFALLILKTTFCITGSSRQTVSLLGRSQEEPRSLRSGLSPYIDKAQSSGNASILVGKQLILTCVIRHLDGQSVSWLRHEGSALLAVDNFLYSTSHRIKVFHNNNEQEWSLSINPVELSDAGIYECQIGTTPHKAHFMAVDVIEPRTSILGTHQLFIETGSTINLTCLIHTGSQPTHAQHIYWNYNGKVITQDRRRGGTIVIHRRPNAIVTSLIISQAEADDSGTYTCDPASSYSQSVVVHVTRGSDAVMRHTIARSSTGSTRKEQLLQRTLALLLPLQMFNKLLRD